MILLLLMYQMRWLQMILFLQQAAPDGDMVTVDLTAQTGLHTVDEFNN